MTETAYCTYYGLRLKRTAGILVHESSIVSVAELCNFAKLSIQFRFVLSESATVDQYCAKACFIFFFFCSPHLSRFFMFVFNRLSTTLFTLAVLIQCTYLLYFLAMF